MVVPICQRSRVIPAHTLLLSLSTALDIARGFDCPPHQRITHHIIVILSIIKQPVITTVRLRRRISETRRTNIHRPLGMAKMIWGQTILIIHSWLSGALCMWHLIVPIMWKTVSCRERQARPKCSPIPSVVMIVCRLWPAGAICMWGPIIPTVEKSITGRDRRA